MRHSEEPVYLILLTPPGRGAIASLRLEGPGALERIRPWIHKCSGQPIDNFPTDRPLVVRFGPEPAEEVVLRCFGPEVVEIHCHGGQAAVDRIQSLLGQSGCQVLDWKRWLSGQPADPIAKEALLCLADALTERTAGILLDQLHGALRGEIQRMVEALQAAGGAQAEQIRSAEEQLSILLEWAAVGRHLTAPWQVVLVGRPNVGKSSLLNALLGYSRAIVHPQPGTTRDVVTATTALDGWPVQLVDTAGWRSSTDPLEQAGIRLAHQQAQGADLVLVVSDLSQPWTETDAAFFREFPAGLLVHTKCDLLPSPVRTEPLGSPAKPPEGVCPSSPVSAAAPTGAVAPRVAKNFLPEGDRPPGVWLSALTGQGLPELIQAIIRRLIPQPPPPGAAIPFTDRQIQALQIAHLALKEKDLGKALNAFQSILSGPLRFAQ